jgi:hypothetical protein
MTKELETKIDKILELKLPMSLTINFDGNGGFKLESKLGEKALNELLTDKKE